MGGNVQSIPEHLADWMKNLPSDVRQKPLHELSFPGSHDSGSYDLDPYGGIYCSQGTWFSGVSCLCCCCCLKWSRCQALDFEHQLALGVRYFDVRVAPYFSSRGNSEELRCVHTMYGPEIRKCMNAVKQFMDQHDGEIVMLDFNHVDGEDKLDKKHHQALFQCLNEVFGDMLFRTGDAQGNALKDQTLDNLCQRGKRVIIFYETKEHGDFWPKHYINSQGSWADTMCVNVWRTKQQEARKHNSSDFYVSQGVLTPDGGTVCFWCCCNTFCYCLPIGSVKTQCADRVRGELLDWIDSKERPHGSAAMIYIADFVDEGFVNAVIDPPKKRKKEDQICPNQL